MKILRIGVVVSVVMSLLAALTQTAQASTGPVSAKDLSKYTGQKLDWTDCTFDPEGVPTRCAVMTVPRDWADPDAGTDLEVYVSKVAATGSQGGDKGVVLTNPGGPGGQGTALAPVIARLQPRLNAAYDVLGMDPRGTGQSGAEGQAGEGITCQVPIERLPAGLLDARDRSQSSIKAHQQVPRAIAEACQSDAVSPYITTWQTAHDMDLLRQLAGADKLNYIGYSYGSWLGAKYASMFPETVGRMILDSSVDWQGRLLADFEDFPRMGQRHTDRVFIPWLTRMAPETFGDTVPEAQKVIEQGRAKAAALELSPDLYDTLFIGNGSELNWALVLIVLHLILAGDDQAAQDKIAALPASLRSQADAASIDRFGVPVARLTTKALVAHRLGVGETEDYQKVPMTRFAVACGDQPTKSVQWYKALSDRQGPKYPLYGWQYGLGEVCGPWTDEPRQQLPTLPSSVRQNVLVVQGEFDPQTSYEQAMLAVKKAPGVNVLRIDDTPFHAQYAVQGNPCVDGVVNTYLLYGSTTPNGICPSIPLPGEEKVYAVRGPVDDYLGGTRKTPNPLKSVDHLLRELVADRISKVNAVLTR